MESRASSRLFYVLQLSVMALAYFCAGLFSFQVSQQHLIVTIVVFAAEGIALGGVLLFGYRLWPGVFIGQLALAVYAGTPVGAAAAIAAANSAEAVLGRWLFLRLRLDPSLPAVRDVIGLMLLIGLVLQPMSALLGNLALLADSVVQWAHLPMSLFSWWFGNTMGQLLITPLLLLLYSCRQHTHAMNLVLVSAGFAALTYLLQVVMGVGNVSLLVSISVLAVVLVAVYQGVQYAALGTTVVTVVSMLAFHNGSSALAGGSSVDTLIDINFFILSHILLGLIIGTLFHEKEAALQRLAAMAQHDALTGLPNRHRLEEIVDYAIRVARRDGERSAVCFIDVDGFKQVNDTLGHRAGDEVLKTIALRIGQTVRDEDLLLRLAGDEFVLVVNHLPEREVVGVLLSRVIEEVERPIETSAGEARVSLSIGIAMCCDKPVPPLELVAEADEAMYRAKQGGKNRFVFYDQ